MALENGIDWTVDPAGEDCIERVMVISGGIGADAAIITASGSASGIVGDAMNCCRKKGRVVLVGDVGLNLRREDFYVKELDFLISTSYGPGRYDPYYELQGNDYPLGYVRWTENRNMQAYLKGLAEKQVSLENLKGSEISLENVDAAYSELKEASRPGLLHIIKYPQDGINSARMTSLKPPTPAQGRVSVALVGAGGFAQGMLLPNLMKLRKEFQLHMIVSQRGATAVSVAKQFEAARAGTDFAEALRDPEVGLVVIATRHHLHAPMVLDALQAGKHVFVEKPLAIKREELEKISECLRNQERPPLLMTGFNRRFSPAIRLIRRLVEQRSSPLMINYRMNAGYLPLSHWVHTEEGGGRNIGEACHIYDLFSFLTGHAWRSARAEAITSISGKWARNDNFQATISYSDGSVCNLLYTALGNAHYPKESMEVFFDQRVITMRDYRVVEEAGKKRPLLDTKLADKGHLEEFSALAAALTRGEAWPISLQDQVAAMEIAFTVEDEFNRSPAKRPSTTIQDQ